MAKSFVRNRSFFSNAANAKKANKNRTYQKQKAPQISQLTRFSASREREPEWATVKAASTFYMYQHDLRVYRFDHNHDGIPDSAIPIYRGQALLSFFSNISCHNNIHIKKNAQEK